MTPRQRRGVLLLGLSAVGLIAVFVLVAGYVADVRGQVEPKVTVLALRSDLAENQPFSAARMGEVSLPERWAPRNAIRDRDALAGLVAAADYPSGSIVQRGMAADPPQLAPGQREIAILVDAQTGVAGKIGPGSTVDIVASFGGDDQRGVRARSEVLVPGARVIDVGQPHARGGPDPSGNVADPQQVVPVTFALSVRQTLRVTYAEVNAQEVRLALVREGERSQLADDERRYAP
jgi:pilus assembly protein CpaB